MTHKQIQIRRKEQISYLPPTVIADARRKLGSIFVSRSPLRGLTHEEEVKYLPGVLGVAAHSPQFETVTRQFWAEFSIDVPSDGVVLDISINDNGEPIHLDDWIKWKWAKKHRFVADSKEGMAGDPLRTFYIYDPDEEVTKINTALQDKKAAYKELIRISKNKGEVIRVLRVLGTNPTNMNDEQRENALSEHLESDPKKFYAVATDKSLETKDFIHRLQEHDVIRRVGASYLYLDDNIGDTTDELVVYLQNKRNSALVNEMKAKLKEREGVTEETVEE